MTGALAVAALGVACLMLVSSIGLCCWSVRILHRAQAIMAKAEKMANAAVDVVKDYLP